MIADYVVHECRKRNANYYCVPKEGEICQLFNSLMPFSESPSMFCETSSEWTAVLSVDPARFNDSVARYFRTECLLFSHTVDKFDPAKGRGPLKNVVFDYLSFQPDTSDLRHRRVQVCKLHSGKIYAASRGDLLDFEHNSMETAKAVKSSLDLSLLQDYSRAVGIRFWDEQFYTGRAIKFGLSGFESGPKDLLELRTNVGFE